MKTLLIAGWRGVSHSFALVNQHQIIALARRGDIALSHVDMPFKLAHWNNRDHGAGFSAADQALIDSLSPANEADVDGVFRICSPLYPPSPQARRTLSWAVTEFGYDREGGLLNPNQDLSELTRGDNLLVTPSRWSRDRLIDFGFDEGRVRVVRHGVDLQRFQPLTSEEFVQQRQALGIPDGAVVFLNVGVPTWNKGLDLLIRCFASLHRRHPHTYLFLKDARGLYGMPVDDMLKNLNQSHPGLLTKEVLAAIRVVTTNLSQADLRHLYGFADWYISPYRAEGFNLPVLEAQACGTPVITSSGGATDDFCNTDGVRKIASVFKRGPLHKYRECCWVEPDVGVMEALMLQAMEEGPRRVFAEDPLRQNVRANAEKHAWDSAVADLVALL